MRKATNLHMAMTLAAMAGEMELYRKISTDT